MGLHRNVERMHAALVGQPVSLPGIAAAAGGHAVGPAIVPTTTHRHQVITGQALAGLELDLGAMAILAAVLVPRKEEGVGDLPAELAGNVNEFDQADDGG